MSRSLAADFILQSNNKDEFNKRLFKSTGYNLEFKTEAGLHILRGKLNKLEEDGELITVSIILERAKQVSNAKFSLKKSKLEIFNNCPIISGRDDILFEIYNFLKNDIYDTLVLVGDEYTGRKSCIMEFARRFSAGMYNDLDVTFTNSKLGASGSCLIRLGDSEILKDRRSFKKYIGVALSSHEKDWNQSIDAKTKVIHLQAYDYKTSKKIFRRVSERSKFINNLDISKEVIKFIMDSQIKASNPLKGMIELLNRSIIYYQFLLTQDNSSILEGNESRSKNISLTVGLVKEVMKENKNVMKIIFNEDAFEEARENINNRIIGQNEQKNQILDTIKNSIKYMRHDRPVSSIMISGPPGVGKSALAKTIAEELFGHGYFFEIDMASMNEKHALATLTGSRPGYIGYGETGLNKIVDKKYGVILFDEIEKAHPDVYPVFLQMMEKGRLMLSSGNNMDLSGFILIFTTNEVEKITSIGFQKIQDDKIIRDKLGERFNKPFISRLNNISFFDNVTEEEIKQAVPVILKEVQDSMINPMEIELSNDLIDEIISKYIPELGLRSIRNYIESNIDKIIEHTTKSNGNQKEDEMYA